MHNIHTKQQILSNLENAIIENKPFSLIRFGDGGLKLIRSYIESDKKHLLMISEKEGIPMDSFLNIIKLWSIYANQANYIDTPFVYDNEYFFWKRYKKDLIPINIKTNQLLKKWDILYKHIGIDVENKIYCNPEFNWLSILDYSPNLFDILKNRKICFISIYDDIPNLSNNYDVTFLKIVKHYENQYENCFHNVISYIENNIDKYDLWLNSSGELGRIYSGRIHELGGRVIDMGFVAQYWKCGEKPERFNKFIINNESNPLTIKLTQMGQVYKISI